MVVQRDPLNLPRQTMEVHPILGAARLFFPAPAQAEAMEMAEPGEVELAELKEVEMVEPRAMEILEPGETAMAEPEAMGILELEAMGMAESGVPTVARLC